MTCPMCQSMDTRVIRTVPGTMVSRQHACCSCPTRWWSDQNLRPGTVQATGSTPLAHRQASAQKDPDLSLIRSPDLKSEPLGNPAGARVEPESYPEAFRFPVVGKDGGWWATTRELDESMRKAFPALPLAAEYAKALAWVNANPTKKKTRRGMPKFLFGWLERAQNRGGPAAARTQDARCAFHRAFGTIGKLPRNGPILDCPECKHVAARQGTRQADPTPLEDVMPKWAGTPASADELAALRGTK